MCGFQGTKGIRENSGGYGERVPPVPIPNTEVKPFSADGTWLETARESRTLPDSKLKPLAKARGFNLPSVVSNFPGLSGKYECTWLGCLWAASSGRREAHGQRPGALSAISQTKSGAFFISNRQCIIIRLSQLMCSIVLG